MGDKYAVCVGTNYTGTPYELAGCINDVRDWSYLLAEQDYSVIPLEEQAASRANILEALATSVGALGWGDRLVFTFSGHGTWVPDASGDETDQRDEAICPHDIDNLITDDDLQAIFSHAGAGSGILSLSDSCHSGTVNRFAAQAIAGRPRYISPHILGLGTQRVVDELEKNAPLRQAYIERATSLISGCDDPEYSYDAEFNGRPNGAFTRHAIDAFTPGASLARWFADIRKRLPDDFYPQSPQLQTASLYRRYLRAL